jgi:hypothetical protein
VDLLCDATGRPVGAVPAAGQRAEVRSLADLLRAAAVVLVRRPARLAGGRGYRAGWVRALLRLCGMKAVIPYRKNERGGASPRATRSGPSTTAPWPILLSSCIT